MSRTDSSLITGMSGASVNKSGRANEAREARRLAKEEKKAHLTPVAQLIIDVLNKEQETVKLSILKTINPTTSEDQVKATITALNLYDSSIKNLKTQLNNIMRSRISDEAED